MLSTLRKPAWMARAAIALTGALMLTAPAGSQDHGMHNSSKVFSDPADLTWKHWDDPLELERTWKAAIVRSPRDRGGPDR